MCDQKWKGWPDTTAAALMEEPDFSKLPRNLHPKIIEALERCLEKEVKNRYGVISDARVDIQRALADPAGVLTRPITATERQSKLRLVLPWVAAGVILAAIIGGVAVWKFTPSEPRQVMRFEYELPEGQEFYEPGYNSLAVSPDGKQFVYCTSKGIYMRSVDELTAKPIAGSEADAMRPFFSPDGKWIGYCSGGKLKKIPVNGGTPVALCDVGSVSGKPWNEDNTITYVQFNNNIMRISADGGLPESIIKLKSGDLADPQILPDRKSILYTSNPASTTTPKIMLQSLGSGESKELFPGSNARYLPTQHIVYKSNNNLFAIPFNLEKPEVKGGSVPILEGVGQYDISDSGTLAYVPRTSTAPRKTLVWVNRDGKEESLSVPPNDYTNQFISMYTLLRSILGCGCMKK
jgi:hypothetical protein